MNTSLKTSPSPSAPRTTHASAARNLVKVFGQGETEVTALNDVSVTFTPGEFTAIMGPSGSGKSTLMHCLAGLDTVDSGQICLGGQLISGMSDYELTVLRRSRVGFIFQSFNLVPTLTAEQNILLPLELAGQKPDRAWYHHIVEVLGIGDRLKHKPSELSGGQQQRVAVARALLTRPDVVFADEPTGALDTTTGSEVLHFLQESAQQFGQTIIMVTHDPYAATFAERVLLLADGQIVGELTDDPSQDQILAALGAIGGGAGAATGRISE